MITLHTIGHNVGMKKMTIQCLGCLMSFETGYQEHGKSRSFNVNDELSIIPLTTGFAIYSYSIDKYICMLIL